MEQFDAPRAYLQAEATTDGTKHGNDLNIYVNQIPGFGDGTDDEALVVEGYEHLFSFAHSCFGCRVRPRHLRLWVPRPWRAPP